jgi:hypothetical protein
MAAKTRFGLEGYGVRRAGSFAGKTAGAADPDADFNAFLAKVTTPRCWLLEVDVLSLAAIGDGDEQSGAYGEEAYSEAAYAEGDSSDSSRLYFSSHGFTSQSADTPASTHYDGRIKGEIRVNRRIHGRSGVGGLTKVFGEVTLVNTDGGLDTLLADYALDGRPAKLLLGKPTDARADFGLVFSGVVQSAEVSEKEFRLRLSDGSALLDVPVNPNTYAGLGGNLEGGTDLAGKAKPKAFGASYNIAPPLVHGALLLYQVHDGTVSDVPQVYDRGVALTKGADYSSQSDMEATAPAAGQYRVWKSGGFFRLGATPAGTVTADVLGDASSSYVNKTADIVQRLLLLAAVDSSLLDSDSFTQLNTDASAEVGIWTGTEKKTIADAIEDLLAGVGAFGGFSRLGFYTVGVIKAPEGSPAASYTDEDVTELKREPLPAEVEPVVWRARVAWQKNYTVQEDLAASVPAARKTFAAEPERVAVREDAAVKSQRLLAREYGPTGNLYAQQNDADAEALRLLNMWKEGRGLYRVVLPPKALSRDLGDEVNITHARHGFSAGRNARVLGHELKGLKVELTVLAGGSDYAGVVASDARLLEDGQLRVLEDDGERLFG